MRFRFEHLPGPSADVARPVLEVAIVGPEDTITCLCLATLQLAEFRWEAPVSFCQPWPFDFQLLGQQGFLRWFAINIDAANESLDIVANTQ